jgi:hypothetical protein
MERWLRLLGVLALAVAVAVATTVICLCDHERHPSATLHPCSADSSTGWRSQDACCAAQHGQSDATLTDGLPIGAPPAAIASLPTETHTVASPDLHVRILAAPPPPGTVLRI